MSKTTTTKTGIFISILLIVVTVGAWKAGNKLGYKDGWSACFTDAISIDRFHDKVHELPNDDDQVQVLALWRECVKTAEQSHDTWQNASLWQRWNYDVGPPYWTKHPNDPPRYLSRKQHDTFVTELRGINQ